MAEFEITYRDEHGVWEGVRWDGKTASLSALGETDGRKAMAKLRGTEPDKAIDRVEGFLL
jgi:hypothetical protein